MDSGKYADGYRNPLDKYTSSRDMPEVRELMKGPRQWASFFDGLLYSLLKNTHGNSSRTIDKELSNYEHNWSEPMLEGVIKESRSLAFYDKKATHAVNELNFHILSKEFLPIWRHALLPEIHSPVQTPEIESIQNQLALRGAELSQVKIDALKWQKIEKSPTGLVTSLNGQLTEIDAAIVMLEIQKTAPHLVLLPAPPFFESSSRNDRSVDFIIMDTAFRQSRGIQVKTYIDSFEDTANDPSELGAYKPVRNYDTRYVTMIDGMVDLGNATMRYIPNKGTVLAPEPGQISLSYLNNNQSADIIQATRNIKDRIIHDLYNK
jgi:hypothetical protein